MKVLDLDLVQLDGLDWANSGGGDGEGSQSSENNLKLHVDGFGWQDLSVDWYFKDA